MILGDGGHRRRIRDFVIFRVLRVEEDFLTVPDFVETDFFLDDFGEAEPRLDFAGTFVLGLA